MDKCPNFWSLFAEALQFSTEQRSLRAFIPWWLFLCCLLPCVLVYWLSPYLRPQVPDASAVTIFSAVAVVAGFFGSVSISTITQVQKMASEYPFSDYLREEKLFDQFLFWPQFTLLLQICLILISTFAAALTRLADYEFLHKYLIAADVGLLLYVCSKTWNLVDLVRRLTWHYEQFNRMYQEEKAKLNAGNGVNQK